MTKGIIKQEVVVIINILSKENVSPEILQEVEDLCPCHCDELKMLCHELLEHDADDYMGLGWIISLLFRMIVLGTKRTKNCILICSRDIIIGNNHHHQSTFQTRVVQ